MAVGGSHREDAAGPSPVPYPRPHRPATAPGGPGSLHPVQQLCYPLRRGWTGRGVSRLMRSRRPDGHASQRREVPRPLSRVVLRAVIAYALVLTAVYACQRQLLTIPTRTSTRRWSATRSGQAARSGRPPPPTAGFSSPPGRRMPGARSSSSWQRRLRARPGVLCAAAAGARVPTPPAGVPGLRESRRGAARGQPGGRRRHVPSARGRPVRPSLYLVGESLGAGSRPRPMPERASRGRDRPHHPPGTRWPTSPKPSTGSCPPSTSRKTPTIP